MFGASASGGRPRAPGRYCLRLKARNAAGSARRRPRSSWRFCDPHRLNPRILLTPRVRFMAVLTRARFGHETDEPEILHVTELAEGPARLARIRALDDDEVDVHAVTAPKSAIGTTARLVQSTRSKPPYTQRRAVDAAITSRPVVSTGSVPTRRTASSRRRLG